MYRKIVWCYVFVLTLLDISLNTKLSAQGKSHGVTVHDSLIEGITFQEWGKESGTAGGLRGGRAVAAGALALSPSALEFGRAALATAHALTVTLTNTANTTMHLASVAGTTPDFHASFFESKTLPPQANTTFSVVYLGRREGPVSAHLYIHTSLGVHKYPVSAVGVASEWGVWPLVGVRVPQNATVEPLLTIHNPTDQTIQVSEVYSSGAWLGLALPGGQAAAPRSVWRVPPRAERPLVRLRIAPPTAPAADHAAHPLTAYIRIKANITGGGLVVCVEALRVAAGEHVSPLQLRLRTRGSRDPPDSFDILAGNSGAAGVALDAAVWGARCAASPPPSGPPPSGPPPSGPPQPLGAAHADGSANGNGGGAQAGAHVALLRPQLAPHQALERAAVFTLDYAALWAGYVGGGRGGGAWCAGWLRLGRATLPYSLRLLPGTLRLTPHQLHFVTANRDDSLRMREVRVRNEFPVPVHIARVDLGPDVDKYFEVESLAPLLVAGGAGAVLARVRLRALTDVPLSSALTLRTNLTDYSLPLLLYSGRLHVEWEWPNSEDGELRLGVVGTSSTRRVTARVHNRAPTTLCVPEHTLELPGATLALTPCAHLRAPPPKHACRCIEAGGSLGAVLTVVAPARAGELRGVLALWAHTPRNDAPPAQTRRAVTLSALPGHVAALPLAPLRAAPYAWAEAPLVLESSMAARMRVLAVALPAHERALVWAAPAQAAELAPGRTTAGTLQYRAERLCEPDCYTGLDVGGAEGSAWLRRADGVSDAALHADAALQAARHAAFRAAQPRNLSLHVHTTHAVQLRARGVAAPYWPRLAPRRAAAGLAPVAAAQALCVRARNPSASHALLLQPVLAAPLADLAGSEAPGACAGCVWAPEAWALRDWRAVRGDVRAWGAGDAERHALPLLLLAPDAELELTLSFAPQQAAHLAAYLYLRNNLTILEGVLLSGRGAYPSFELGGRRPGASSPLLFEVSECGATVRRTLLARNTGPVGVLLRDWRLAGQPCQARGFRLTPCAPLRLQPNESRALTLAFSPDYTLARVTAELSARTDTARAVFLLAAAAPARLLPRCAALAPRPPWEPAARAAATLLALAALALVLAAAALDAERELRRARQARPPPAARQPLDLRALAQHAPAPAPAPAPRRAPARRRRTPRRDAPALDPQAERRAFERWRAEVLGRNDDDDSRSSEDADRDDERRAPEPAPEHEEPPEPRAEPPAATDGYEADPETEDRPQGSGDDDAVSTGSGSASASSSSPTADERDEADDRDQAPVRAHAAPSDDGGAPTAPGPGSDASARAVRARCDACDTPRRAPGGRTSDPGEAREARPRAGAAKHHVRKDKPSKRLRERPALSPPRSPPPRAEARAPGLRWGASWSSVVARGPAPALAPIGSDVRRRAEPERALGGAGDHSLFYFNGDAAHAQCRESDFSWRPPLPVERPTFTPARDFLDEPSAVGGVGGVGAVGAVGSGSFRSLNSVWGSSLEPRPAAAAWLWGGYAEPAAAAPAGPVRPPPGFGPPPRAVRPYDPFRSLASIWAPGALDWRAEQPEGGAEPDA